MSAARGLMLVNLGTPASTSTGDVRAYLREFLSDPRVIDIPGPLRALLLYGAILPFRPRQSAEAYRKVWTERGSPLLYHGLDLVEKVAARLGDAWRVDLAMRYGEPSIASVLERFRAAGVDRLTVLPLFPQYSSAATGSAVEKVWEEAGTRWNVPPIDVLPAFYDDPGFLRCFAAVARPVLAELRPERVLLSFHGVPERHVTKSDESGGRHCLRSEGCCDRIVAANRNCYRAQCFATARGLVAELGRDPGLPEDLFEVTFQSRLGRTPWIRPYTDLRVRELAEQGVKRVAVMSPAFVADCLETLEELAIRAREDFEAHGGERLVLIPSLNARDDWADAVVDLVLRGLQSPVVSAGRAAGRKGEVR